MNKAFFKTLTIIVFVIVTIAFAKKAKSQDAYDPTGERTLKVGTYTIGEFCAPDEIHSNRLIRTRNHDSRVKLQMVITSIVGDSLKGYVYYATPVPKDKKVKLVRIYYPEGNTFHVAGEQKVPFTAIREGKDYIFDFKAGNKIQFFVTGQDYDFDMFDGTYVTDATRNTLNSGIVSTLILVKKTGSPEGRKIGSMNRDATFELDKKLTPEELAEISE